jgi:hypothetical protein
MSGTSNLKYSKIQKFKNSKKEKKKKKNTSLIK